MKRIRTFLLIMLFLFRKYGFTKENFFKKDAYCYDNNLGWKFYCDDEDDIEEDKKEDLTIREQDYIAELKKIASLVDYVKARAVLYPNEENVKEYMLLQQRLLNQASYFSDVWRRVIWSHPELDYTQKRPTSNLGSNIWRRERDDRMVRAIKNINKRYGIFFIYSTTCDFCKKFGEILYDFKNNFAVEIKGISIDGRFLPNWERNSFVNRGHLESLGINYTLVPITVLFDMEKSSIIPIGYGLMTQDDLMERIYVLTQTNVGEDY